MSYISSSCGLPDKHEPHWITQPPPGVMGGHSCLGEPAVADETPDVGVRPVVEGEEALDLAEEVWDDEPTQAEIDLIQRVLASDWLAARDAKHARVLEKAQGEIARLLAAWKASAQVAQQHLTRLVEAEQTLEKVQALADEVWRESQGDHTIIDDAWIMQDIVERLRAALDSSARGVDGEEAVEG